MSLLRTNDADPLLTWRPVSVATGSRRDTRTSAATVEAIIAEVLVVVWLLGHMMSWWLHYFGLSFRSQREAYVREYSRTLKFLPLKVTMSSSTSSTWSSA